MALFEEMLDMKRRRDFLEFRESRKNNDSRIQNMTEYLLSSCYEDDVKRLALGNYHISAPVPGQTACMNLTCTISSASAM